MSNKIVTVRLPEGQVTDLETIARFDGVAVAELLRAGVELVLESRRADPAFRAKVEAAYADAQRILDGVEVEELAREVFTRPLPDAEAAVDEPAGVGASN